MSDPLSTLPTDLQSQLLTLRNLSPYGVLAVECPEGKPLYIWWGDRSQALAATARLSHGINTEEDEGYERDSADEDEHEDDAFEPFKPAPLLGLYL